MRGSKGGRSGDGSSGSPRVPPITRPDKVGVATSSVSLPELPLFNSTHVRVIPSLHVSLPSDFKYLQVQTLTKETIALAVHPKCRVRDAYLCCCSHLGMTEDRLMGLALRTPSEGLGGDRPRHEYFFLDPSQKITKYAPKQSKLSHAWSSVAENRPLLVLHLRVRIYVDKVQLIRCPTVIQHYYLQLRENLLDQWSGSNSVSEERCWEMAALALQADQAGHEQSYFRAEQYFPLWVINLRGLDFVRRNMPAVRSDLRPCSRIDAALEYCHEASRSPFALNCHLYGLRRHKMDTIDNAIIGITPRGIDMSDVGIDGERIPLRSLRWGRMAKLSFDKRKLSITGMDGACMSLYAQSEHKARYLLEFCKAVHQALIQINNQYYLNPYAYPADVTSSFSCGEERSVDGPVYSRQFAASRTSSNSTSGVVSDKPNSEPDKECDWAGTSRATSECSYEGLRNQGTSEGQNYDPETREHDSQSGHGGESSEGPSKCVDLDIPLSAPLLAHTASLKRASLSARSRKSTVESEPLSSSVATLPNQTVEGPNVSTEVAKLESEENSPSLGLTQEESKTETELAKPRSVSITEFKDTESTTFLHSGGPTGARAPTPSHSGNIASLFKVVNSGGENATAVVPSILKREERVSDLSGMDIKQPPHYSEAISSSGRIPFDDNSLMRPSTNPNMKPRWTTVAGVASRTDLSYFDPHRPLQYSANQARSEPKLDQQVWSRPLSPPSSLCSSVQPLMLSSSRPTTSSTPAFAGVPAALFQKQFRLTPRAAHAQTARGISRVQSMPAHNPPLYLHNNDAVAASSQAPAALHHAHSLAARPLAVETKQPPPYEHAILQQARARYAQKAAAAASGGTAQITMGELDRTGQIHKEILQKRNSYSNENEEDLTMNTRIRQYPMMRALWHEHQQEGMGPSAGHCASPLNISSHIPPSLGPSSSNGISGFYSDTPNIMSTSMNGEFLASSVKDELFLESLMSGNIRKPSSYQDLSSPIVLTPPNSAPLHQSVAVNIPQVPYIGYSSYVRSALPYRGEYCFDHALYRPYTSYGNGQQTVHNSWSPSPSVLDLPPPPPYPPPRSSPSPREALVM